MRRLKALGLSIAMTAVTFAAIFLLVSLFTTSRAFAWALAGQHAGLVLSAGVTVFLALVVVPLLLRARRKRKD